MTGTIRVPRNYKGTIHCSSCNYEFKDVEAEYSKHDCRDETIRKLEAERDDYREALIAAKYHIQELEDAWLRGCITENDGKGGTRSNRNVDVRFKIYSALTKHTKPQKED